MTDGYEGKKLLLLGGVRAACEIIHEAKQMKIETFVTDYLANSPAKKIADHSYMVNAIDVDAVVKLCRAEKIDGIITGYVDMLLPFYQKICQRLGKPCWGNAVNINMAINKEEFKMACERSGVPVVTWKKTDRMNYKDVLKNIALPVVLKPIDNSGARGVFKCFDPSSVNFYAEQALSFSKSGEILIEEAMNPHNEFSVYYILNHGEYYLTAMGDRYVNIIEDNIAPVGQGMLFPSVHLNEWIGKMDSIVKKFFADNDMNNGFVFLQGFYKNGSFYIHEMGYRLNGGFSYKIIEHFSGYNQIQELIKFSLSGSMENEKIMRSNPHFNGYGMILTFTLKPGTIGHVSGIEEVRKMKGVLNFYQLHEAGEKLLSHGTTAQVFAYVLCASDTEEEMINLAGYISQKLKVYDSDGNNLLYSPIDPYEIKFER